MSKKPILPGVDQEALAALARQFPGSTTTSGGFSAISGDNPLSGTETQTSPPKASEAKLEAAASPFSRPARRGGWLAAFALLVALAALVLAGIAVAPPTMMSKAKKSIGSTKIFEALTGQRDAVNARLTVDASAIKSLEADAKSAKARLGAIEAVGGSSNAAATRIAALEAAVNSLAERTAANDELVKVLVDRFGRDEQKAAAVEAALKATGTRVDEAQKAIKDNGERTAAVETSLNKTLGEIGASVAALKKIDRQPERLYLLAMQLRNATRGAGPYAKELAALRPLAANSAEAQAAIKVLASHAQRGVATVADLNTSFDAVLAPRLAAIAPANRTSFAERAVAWARSWFSATPAAYEPRANRNAAVVALAQRNLAAGQLAPAVDQLLLLEDQSALVAAEWLQEASARLAVDKASATLVSVAFERLAATP